MYETNILIVGYRRLLLCIALAAEIFEAISYGVNSRPEQDAKCANVVDLIVILDEVNHLAVPKVVMYRFVSSIPFVSVPGLQVSVCCA